MSQPLLTHNIRHNIFSLPPITVLHPSERPSSPSAMLQPFPKVSTAASSATEGAFGDFSPNLVSFNMAAVIFCALAAYLLRARMASPYIWKTKGSGVHAKARKAGMLEAHWFPRFWYMYGVKSGLEMVSHWHSHLILGHEESERTHKAAANRPRRIAFAARAEAA